MLVNNKLALSLPVLLRWMLVVSIESLRVSRESGSGSLSLSWSSGEVEVSSSLSSMPEKYLRVYMKWSSCSLPEIFDSQEVFSMIWTYIINYRNISNSMSELELADYFLDVKSSDLFEAVAIILSVSSLNLGSIESLRVTIIDL